MTDLMTSIHLEPLGLSRTQETVYRWLVRSGISPLSEVAVGARVPLAQARSAVTALERMHLIVRAPGRPARFSAAAPDIALEALLAARQQSLDQTRLEV